MDPTRISSIAIGKVTGVDDPEQIGRVRVLFSWASSEVQQWVPVVSPMAGNQRGWFSMPEVDDEVAVAFDQGSFDHPYVIGYLWNKLQKPPSPDPRQRMFGSVMGHRIRFTDGPDGGGDKGSLVIEDAYGNTIVMTNNHVSITSRGAIDINAPMVSILGRPVRQVGPPI